MTQKNDTYQVVVIKNTGQELHFAQSPDIGDALSQVYFMFTGKETKKSDQDKTADPQCPEDKKAAHSQKHSGLYCPNRSEDGSYCKWTTKD